MIFDAVFERDLFTVRRYGVGPKDALGRPTRVLASEVTVSGTLAQTGLVDGSVEVEGLIVNRYKATMPAGTDVRADDEIVSQGLRYTVEGAPFTSHVPGMPAIGVVTAVLKYVGPVAS